MSLTAKIDIGTASANAEMAPDIGRLFIANGKVYRLVKAANAITAAAKKTLVTAVSSGNPTWVVDVSTTANDYLVAGVVPVGQTGSSGTTGLLAGDYFYLQVGGPALCIAAAAITAGKPVGCSTTAGKVDDASVVAAEGSMGTSLVAATNADDPVYVRLTGLF